MEAISVIINSRQDQKFIKKTLHIAQFGWIEQVVRLSAS